MLLVNNRYLFVIALLFLQVNSAKSQEDPVSITESNESGRSKTSYQYFDINQFEQKTLYKASAFSQGSYAFNDISILHLAVERKIFPSLSAELTWHASYLERHTLVLGMRYYPAKRAQSKAKKDRVNNFTGNYISAGYGKSFEFGANETTYVVGGTLFDNDETFSIAFGRQEKVGKWGFYDARFPVNYFSGIESLQLGFNLMIGIGYGPTSTQDLKQEPDKHAPAEGTFFEGKNIIALENPYCSFGKHFKLGGLSLSGEFQMADYFSVVTNLMMGFVYDLPLPTATSARGADYDQYWLALNTGLRRYVGVQKRLRKGKPVQKFTGTYVGVKAYHLFVLSEVDISRDAIANREVLKSETRFSPLISGHFGWQRRMGKSVFFDVNIGAGYDTYWDTFELTGQIRTGILLRK